MKKLISSMLVLSMLTGIFAMCGVSVFAEDDIVSYLAYEIVDGEAVITSCDSEMLVGDIELPDTIEGYPVTKIADFAFSSCKSLTSVIIPDSITTIGNLAFDECMNLESVIIPYSVTEIGTEVFYFCPKLKNIKVDANNTNYSSSEDGVLFDKNKTKIIVYPAGNSGTEYVIPDSVRIIEPSAFFASANLKKIEIPDSVENICAVAFAYCYNLEEIIIPDSVTSTIGTSTFAACVNLKNVIIGNGVSGIESFAFFNCTGLENVDIGSGVTFIESYSFESDFGNNLRSITIPENVESIGKGAFVNCYSLTEINILNPDAEIDEKSLGYTNIEVLVDYDKYISMLIATCVDSCNREITGEEYDEEEKALAEEVLNSFIMLDEYRVLADSRIYGYKNSTAELYATENNIRFAELGQKITPDDEEKPTAPEAPSDVENNDSRDNFIDIISKFFEKIVDFFTQIFSSLKILFE